MPRKKQSKLAAYIIILVLCLMALGALIDLTKNADWASALPIVIVIILIVIVIKVLSKSKKRSYLIQKYNDSEIADKILQSKVWVGQTAEQLIDTLGQPKDVDVKVLKTKKKEIWKYQHQRGNQYKLRITLDDDVVVGWDKK